MSVLNKDNIARPIPPKEVVDVPELGGEVIVRGLLLTERVRILNSAQKSGLVISDLLACSVIDAQNEPIFTADEWEAFGAQHFKAAVDLFVKAKALSGLDADINEKK